MKLINKGYAGGLSYFTFLAELKKPDKEKILKKLEIYPWQYEVARLDHVKANIYRLVISSDIYCFAKNWRYE